MAKLKYQGREFDLVRSGTFQEASDVEAEAGVAASAMTNAQSVAMSFLITLRRNGIALTWADIMTMDSDLFDLVDEPDPTDAAPVVRVPQDRKPRKAPARRAGGAAGSQAG